MAKFLVFFFSLNFMVPAMGCKNDLNQLLTQAVGEASRSLRGKPDCLRGVLFGQKAGEKCKKEDKPASLQTNLTRIALSAMLACTKCGDSQRQCISYINEENIKKNGINGLRRQVRSLPSPSSNPARVKRAEKPDMAPNTSTVGA